MVGFAFPPYFLLIVCHAVAIQSRRIVLLFEAHASFVDEHQSVAAQNLIMTEL